MIKQVRGKWQLLVKKTERSQFLSVGGNGLIYETGWHDKNVRVFAPDGTLVDVWKVSGCSSLGGLAVVSGITIAAATASALSTVRELCAFPPGLVPLILAYIAHDTVYVVRFLTTTPELYAADCYTQLSCNPQTRIVGWKVLKRPGVCATTPDGRLFVHDSFSKRIHVFGSDGESFGTWDRAIGVVRSMAVDGLRKRLYVVDGSENCLRAFTFTGDLLWKTECYDHQYGSLYGLVVGQDGWVFVSDFGRKNILAFSSDGNCVYCNKYVGDEIPNMTPGGLAFSSNGDILYVADTHNGNILTICI